MPIDILNQIKEYWNRLSKKLKIYIAASLGAVILISVISSILLNVKNFEVLYSGLSSTEQAQIVSRLGELAVDFKTQGGGIIKVPSRKIAELKMQLSSEGYPKSTLTYDLFQSNTDFMTTDFDKKQFLVFQLQDRLQASINTIDGVKDSIVTISVSPDSSYVIETSKVPTTASLIIDIEPGYTLNNQQIKGIENLVAKSVPGLENKNVSIIDSSGNILNKGYDEEFGSSLVNVEIEKQASEIFRNKIITLLQPIFGERGISAAVNVSIDFTKKTSDEISYTPTTPATTPPTTTPTTPPTTTPTTPTTQNDLVNQVQKQISSSGGEIKDITAAILINKDLTEDEKTSISKTVAYAIGADVEKVILTNMEFSSANNIQKRAESAFNNNSSFIYKYGKYAFYGAAFIAILFLLYFFLTKRKRNEKDDMETEVNMLTTNKIGALAEPVPAIVLTETREQGLKRQIKDFTATNPNIVAQLLRTWLKEEHD